MPYDSQNHHRRSIRLRDYDYRQAGAYYVTICVEKHRCLLGRITDATMHPTAAGRMVEAAWHALPEHYPGVALDAFVLMPNHLHGIILLTDEATPPDDASAPDPPPAPDASPPPNAASPAPLPVRAGPRACPADGDASAENDAQADGADDNGEGGPARGPAPTGLNANAGVGRLSLPEVVHRFKSLTTARYRHGVHYNGWPPFPGRLWQRNYWEHIVRDDRDLDRIRRYIAENPARWPRDRLHPDR